MADNLVNLKEKMKEMSEQKDARAAVPKPATSKEGQIERVYGVQGANAKSDFQKMDKPRASGFKPNEKAVRIAVFIIALILIPLVVKLIFFRGNKVNGDAAPVEKWYAVKLVDGEMFFGQIADNAADPIVIKNVYYDYDQVQAKDGKTDTNPAGNLRLVKKGKETYGPDGSLDVVRSQVISMEPLKDDSKVLKAILDYEK